MRALVGLLWIGGLAAAGWLALRWLIARGAAERNRWAEQLRRVSALSSHDAAGRANALLADPTRFHVVASARQSEVGLEMLAPELRKILSTYESIKLLKEPGAYLERSAIGPSENAAGFLRIGRAAEGSDSETEVIVKPGEETVYEVGRGERLDPTFGTYKSVHHWIVAIEQEAE